MRYTKGTQQYTATGSYLNNKKPAGIITADWTSNNISVAMIDSTGLATAGTMQGTAYISAASTAINGTRIFSDTPDAELNVRCFNYTVHYRQNQSPWMNDVYDDYAATGGMLNSGMLDHSIGAVGCYIVSVANAMNATGMSVTPVDLDNWMKKPNDGFDPSTHTANKDRAFDYPGSHVEAITDWQSVDIADIKYQLSQCNMILARVVGTTAFTGGHYVLIVKEDTSGRLMMLDPWRYSTDPDGLYYEYVDRRYTITNYKVLGVK